MFFQGKKYAGFLLKYAGFEVHPKSWRLNIAQETKL